MTEPAALTHGVPEGAPRPAGREMKAVILLLCIPALAMIVATGYTEWWFANNSGGAREESDLGIALAFFLITVIGALAAMGQPRNAVGWALMLSGLAISIAGIAEGLGYYLMTTRPDSSTGLVVAWLAGIGWMMGIVLLLLVFPFIFPNGRLPGPRWRPVFAVVMLFVAAVLGVQLLSPLVSRKYLDPTEVEQLLGPHFLLFPLLALLGVVSLIVRYRRANVETRQQMKWLLLTVGIPIAVFLVLAFIEDGFGVEVSNVIWGGVYLMIPIGLGISLLRYKMFDVDTVIRKTAVYTILTVLLALVYFGLVVVLQRLLLPIIGDTTPVVVLSTLLIAALFLPLRRRVQAFIDRRFYRRKYDAEKVLARFAAAARDETDVDALTAELVRVIEETMQPEHVMIWLREPSSIEGKNGQG